MRSTTEKCFLDTNFLVYLFSKDDKAKRSKSAEILSDRSVNRLFVVSTQVIKEFAAVMIRKYKMPPLDVKAIIGKLEEFEVVHINVPLIQRALDIHLLNKLSFWDSLIICAAASTKCSVLFSEDMNDGQVVNGVTIMNPFS